MTCLNSTNVRWFQIEEPDPEIWGEESSSRWDWLKIILALKWRVNTKVDPSKLDPNLKVIISQCDNILQAHYNCKLTFLHLILPFCLNKRSRERVTACKLPWNFSSPAMTQSLLSTFFRTNILSCNFTIFNAEKIFQATLEPIWGNSSSVS